MRALGFVVGICAVAATWYWQQSPSVQVPQAQAPAEVAREEARKPGPEGHARIDRVDDFGDDLGDFGTSTYSVPPPADWIVRPPGAASAPVEPQWLVITRPFSSATAAQAFSEAVASDTGLHVAVQNPVFREYSVVVRLDESLSREQALAALNGQYSWMEFE